MDIKKGFVLHGHIAQVIDSAYSSDDMLLASYSQDNTIKIWDMVSGECISTLQVKEESSNLNNAITAVAFSYDNTSIIGILTTRKRVSNRLEFVSDSIIIWDRAAGEYGKELLKRKVPIRALACAPDKSQFAFATKNNVELWNIDPLTCIKTFKSPKGCHFNTVVYSPDGKKLTFGLYVSPYVKDYMKTDDEDTHRLSAAPYCKDYIETWHIDTQTYGRSITCDCEYSVCSAEKLVYSSNGSYLIAIVRSDRSYIAGIVQPGPRSDSYMIKIIQISSLAVMNVIYCDYEYITYAPGSAKIAYYSPDSGFINIIGLQNSKKILQQINEHTGQVQALIYSHTGNMLACAVDATIVVYF